MRPDKNSIRALAAQVDVNWGSSLTNEQIILTELPKAETSSINKRKKLRQSN